MKIFKNRGDIYISKSKFKSSKEEKILVLIMIAIVILTAVFVVLLSQKYNTVSEFFADGEVSVTDSLQNGETKQSLPKIQGKSNFLLIETDDENSSIHYLMLIQADKDSLAYKVSTLSPDMTIDGTGIYDIYETGGGASLQSKLTEYFGFEIDYYVQFEKSNFVEFVNELGTFIYPSSAKIKFNGGSGDDTYSVRLKEGEQTLDGKDLSNLLRYFTNEEKNYSLSNEIMLYALTDLVNPDNFEDKEYLFRLFISTSSTNITVRNFTDNADALSVFCTGNNGITVYGVTPEYDSSQVITQSSVKEIKGYFNK